MKVFDHSKENMYLNGINQILIFYSFCVLLNHLKSKIKNWFIATLKKNFRSKKASNFTSSRSKFSSHRKCPAAQTAHAQQAPTISPILSSTVTK